MPLSAGRTLAHLGRDRRRRLESHTAAGQERSSPLTIADHLEDRCACPALGAATCRTSRCDAAHLRTCATSAAQPAAHPPETGSIPDEIE